MEQAANTGSAAAPTACRTACRQSVGPGRLARCPCPSLQATCARSALNAHISAGGCRLETQRDSIRGAAAAVVWEAHAAAMQHVPPSRTGAPACTCRPISASSDVIEAIQSACDSVAPVAEDFSAPPAPPAGELRLSHAHEPVMGPKTLVAALAPLLIVALVAAPRWAPCPTRCAARVLRLLYAAALHRCAQRPKRQGLQTSSLKSPAGPRLPRPRQARGCLATVLRCDSRARKGPAGAAALHTGGGAAVLAPPPYAPPPALDLLNLACNPLKAFPGMLPSCEGGRSYPSPCACLTTTLQMVAARKMLRR